MGKDIYEEERVFAWTNTNKLLIASSTDIVGDNVFGIGAIQSSTEREYGLAGVLTNTRPLLPTDKLVTITASERKNVYWNSNMVQ